MTLELLANAAVRMSLVGAIAWLTLRALRVRNPHLETLVCRMLLLASLALPALLYWSLAPSFPTSLQLPVISAAGASKAATSVGAASALMPVARIATTIYIGTALVLVVRLAGGLAAMWRIVRVARPMATPGDVRISEQISSPATFGTIILVPRDAQEWPADKLDAVLLHERMHVRGHDGYWSWLARLHTAVFWFSPLAWWLQRRLETLAEITSDDAVVAARHDPVAYAALLLEFARQPNSRSVVMSVAESNVPVRIERLLSRIPPAAAVPRLVRWAAFALLIPGVVLTASTTRAAAPAESAAAAPVEPASQAPLAQGFGIVKPADPDEFYPEVAKSEHVTGMVTIKVSLDPMGQLVKADVVEVTPADPRYGFADAALQVAQRSQYKNDTRQEATFFFKVKFALAED
ncbi:MAG TPA: M56 family metallopeptidase [Steroidobacteraceae bacterium]|nr:M56 family metallopeptidase [Steroidobacteraceae bacterium]